MFQSLTDIELYILWDSFETIQEDGSFIQDELKSAEVSLKGKFQIEWVKRGYYNEEELTKKFSYIFDEGHRRYH